MIGYKLFRVRKNGTLGSLFINRKAVLKLNEWLDYEEHLTKNFKFRPGWHICKSPNAPHLSMKNRKWYKVEFEDFETLKRPLHQGDDWYIAKRIKILEKHD